MSVALFAAHSTGFSGESCSPFHRRLHHTATPQCSGRAVSSPPNALPPGRTHCRAGEAHVSTRMHARMCLRMHERILVDMHVHVFYCPQRWLV